MIPALNPVSDSTGRTFKTLRVSLLNTCNFGCVYCVEDDKSNIKLTAKPLGAIELGKIILSLNEILGLKTVRLTGGEPTLYKDLILLINILKTGGIESIKITTNGFLLNQIIPDLINAGVKEINISMDAIDPEIFFIATRRRALKKVIESIDTAISSGLKVKLNTVVVRGLNDQEILPLYHFAKERKISIRFLELMRMGHLHKTGFTEKFFSEQEILRSIQENYEVHELPRTLSSTARYWMDNDNFMFGIISNESTPFCGDCDRLRLDNYGNIYGCISSKLGIQINNTINNKNDILQDLRKALSQKQDKKFVGSEVSMVTIGG